ncbi:unnamed protein product [Rotaria sordida]|uniref:Uncharacterized protein n=1 Tax=Rotaria sordida TaxID=392033 RepID=A0A813PP06_9BILA|nr:unnamed protein product [Rotaria sordida]
MRLFLFSIVTICIAGSRTQEIAIGTEYLRANSNDSLPSESGINAQDQEPLPTLVVTDDATITNDTLKDHDHDHDHHHHHHHDHDHSSYRHDDHHKKYDHEHHSHHAHDTTITVDLHNIFDLIKQQLHETEEHIIASIKQSQSASPVPVEKSYRTADR